MAGYRRSATRIHDVAPRQWLDKAILLVAFVVGVAGSVLLKLLGVHPFAAAGFAAGVLVGYAALTYATTSLRLDPEVIGDNTYYLGFLFTLASLSVTLYVVAGAGVEERALLIPQVISGFGVALSSTIMGVFVRVLMMQFRLDMVARERETRADLDQAARRLRVELGQSLQRIKAFGIETMQHAREREAAFEQATDDLVQASNDAIARTARAFETDLRQTLQDGAAAAIGDIRTSVAGASGAALDQMRQSLAEIARISEDMQRADRQARDDSQRALATLQQQTSTLTEHLALLARRMRTVADDIETSGGALARTVATATDRVDTAATDATRRMETTFRALDLGTQAAALHAARAADTDPKP